jgi:DNA polymerase (family X)
MPTNRDVLAMLAELAKLTVLDEESPQSFKVRAYENALHGIEGMTDDVTVMSVAELVKVKGVGKSIAEKIREFVDTGSVAKLEQLRAAYPPAFVELTKIPGLGPKTLKLVRRELGVETLEDLQAAIAGQALRTLPGLGATSEEKISKAIERLGLHGKDRRTPISEAMPLAERLVADLTALPGVTAVEYCGSLRRLSETIGDVDVTVASDDPQPVMDFVATHGAVAEVIAHGATKTSILTRQGLQVDVRVVSPDQFGSATLYFTGSKSHNIALRQKAIDRGWLLNEYGLIDKESGRVIASATEEEIYSALGLAYIPPPMREATGEIEAAAGATIDLVTMDDIRGDLHYHTTRSGDGRSSLEEMVEAAIARGYEYVAITDHGEDLSINGSTKEQMLAHRDAIARIQEAHPEISLLFGCELNIDPKGGLDYDPDFRALFDFTVASVHSHFDLPAAKQTERLLTAMADPSVNVIGHLTGRYIGRRPGIELDLDAVLEGLAITGVALEVNGALERLDASADVIRKAVARGVSLTISTDSHHTSELGRMRYGVLNAQRGWAPASSVANTLSRDEFLAWVGARR